MPQIEAPYEAIFIKLGWLEVIAFGRTAIFALAALAILFIGTYVLMVLREHHTNG